MSEYIADTLGAVGAVIVVVLVLAGLFFGGWALYQYNVNRDAQVQRQSYNAQKTYRDEIQNQMADVATIDVQIADPANAPEVGALKAQRIAVVNQICQIATNLTTSDLNGSQVKFISVNCPEGTLP